MGACADAPRVKTLRDIFGNAWVLLGLAAFGASLAILWRNPAFGREDAIGGIVIFGIAFPLLAWATTLRARPRNLIALMFIHAATDLLPNLKQFISTWGI
jgi:hypothetical protein